MSFGAGRCKVVSVATAHHIALWVVEDTRRRLALDKPDLAQAARVLFLPAFGGLSRAVHMPLKARTCSWGSIHLRWEVDVSRSLWVDVGVEVGPRNVNQTDLHSIFRYRIPGLLGLIGELSYRAAQDNS